MYPAEAKPPPATAFQPPVWPKALSEPPPLLVWDQWRGGGFFRPTPTTSLCDAPPGPVGILPSLLSTAVTFPGPMRGRWGGRSV